MNLVSTNGFSSVEWIQGSLAAQKQQPLTWHKVLTQQMQCNDIVEDNLMVLNIENILL